MTQRINKGTTLQGLPAATWNRFCDVADQTPKAPQARVINPGTPGQAIDILVQNKTGVDLASNFPILRLTTPIFDIAANSESYLNGVSFQGDEPDADTKANFVVMQGRCPIDGICAAVIQGATWCRVNVTDAAHTHATAIDTDTTRLASGTGTGARILWKESGTGEKWAIVLLGGGGGGALQWGQATSIIAAATAWGSPGTGQVQFKDSAGANDGSPVTVENNYWDAFDDKSIVCCDRGFDPPLVVAVGCTPGT